jgi:hypothetical protein
MYRQIATTLVAEGVTGFLTYLKYIQRPPRHSAIRDSAIRLLDAVLVTG